MPGKSAIPEAVATIGIDIGKNTFHLIGLDKTGAIVLRQKLSRGQVNARLANMSPCLIGMEACVGAQPPEPATQGAWARCTTNVRAVCYVKLNQLRTNNEVAGFKFATVGVLYAVLLAFAVVVVWEKFNQAESEVAKEAGAAATVFRLTQGVDPERGAAIREATTDYLTSAIASDWPAMERAARKAPLLLRR
jgi:hypothetical protein